MLSGSGRHRQFHVASLLIFATLILIARCRREDFASMRDRVFQTGTTVMTHLQRQRSCSLSDCAVRIDSSGDNDHVASVPTGYIISYSGISYYVIS